MPDDFIIVHNYRTNTDEEVSKDSLLTLANAIIIQSCIDYMDNIEQRIYIEKFLKSEYALLLMRDSISPEAIITNLREEVKNTNDNRRKSHKKRIH